MNTRLLFIVAWIGCVSSAQAQSPKDAEFTQANPKFVAAFKESVAGPSQSTVRILCAGKDTALGMIVGPDGWILTKANDLLGPVTIRLRDGSLHDAKLVGIHVPHDLALLKIEKSGLKPVDFKSSKEIEAGSWVACVGHGEEPVAIGVISVPTREMSFKGPTTDPSKSPYLGVSLETEPSGGAKIKEVIPSTPAATAGLKVDDVILSLAGTTIESTEHFMETINKFKPNDTVKLTLRRGGFEIERSAKLANRPLGSFRGEMQNRMGSELSSRRTGYATILQHDSVVKPSDCGGPIVDLDGRVLGINICRAGRTESWAVPTETIQPLLFELMSGKLAPPSSRPVKHTMEERLEIAKATLARAEREQTRGEKELAEARKSVVVAETELKGFRTKMVGDSGDKLVSLTQKRLAMMNEVAGFKWNHRQEVHDPAREKESLARLLGKAKESGADAKLVTRFFTAQFEAARLLQQDRIAGWQKDNILAPETAELKKDLRPVLDQMNDELLDALVNLHKHWKDVDSSLQNRVRQQARAIAGPGINAAIRDKAIEAMLP